MLIIKAMARLETNKNQKFPKPGRNWLCQVRNKRSQVCLSCDLYILKELGNVSVCHTFLLSVTHEYL